MRPMWRADLGELGASAVGRLSVSLCWGELPSAELQINSARTREGAPVKIADMMLGGQPGVAELVFCAASHVDILELEWVKMQTTKKIY